MNLLNPEFLPALFACLIPIILYVLFKRQIKRVDFSSIRFLKEIDAKSVIKSSWLEIIILLLRILTILFLVLGFLNPIISKNYWFTTNVESVHFLVLDRSTELNITQNNKSLLQKRNETVLEFFNQIKPAEKVFVVNPKNSEITLITKETAFSTLEGFSHIKMDSIPVQHMLNTINMFCTKEDYSSHLTYFISSKKLEAKHILEVSLDKKVINDRISSAKLTNSILTKTSSLKLNIDIELDSVPSDRMIDVIIDGKTIYSEVLSENQTDINIGRFAEGDHLGKVILSSEDHFLEDNHFYFNFTINSERKILVFYTDENSYLYAFFKDFPDSLSKITLSKSVDVFKHNFSDFNQIFYEGENVSLSFKANISSYLKNRLNSFVYIPSAHLVNTHWNQSSFNQFFRLDKSNRNNGFVNALTIENKAILSLLDKGKITKPISFTESFVAQSNYLNIIGNKKHQQLISNSESTFFFFNSSFSTQNSNFVIHEIFSPSMYFLMNQSKTSAVYADQTLKLFGSEILNQNLIAQSNLGDINFFQSKKDAYVNVYTTNKHVSASNYSIKTDSRPYIFSVNEPRINTQNIFMTNSKRTILPRSEAGSLWRICVLFALLCYLLELWLGKNIKH